MGRPTTDRFGKELKPAQTIVEIMTELGWTYLPQRTVFRKIVISPDVATVIECPRGALEHASGGEEMIIRDHALQMEGNSIIRVATGEAGKPNHR